MASKLSPKERARLAKLAGQKALAPAEAAPNEAAMTAALARYGVNYAALVPRPAQTVDYRAAIQSQVQADLDRLTRPPAPPQAAAQSRAPRHAAPNAAAQLAALMRQKQQAEDTAWNSMVAKAEPLMSATGTQGDFLKKSWFAQDVSNNPALKNSPGWNPYRFNPDEYVKAFRLLYQNKDNLSPEEQQNVWGVMSNVAHAKPDIMQRLMKMRDEEEAAAPMLGQAPQE